MTQTIMLGLLVSLVLIEMLKVLQRGTQAQRDERESRAIELHRRVREKERLDDGAALLSAVRVLTNGLHDQALQYNTEAGAFMLRFEKNVLDSLSGQLRLIGEMVEKDNERHGQLLGTLRGIQEVVVASRARPRILGEQIDALATAEKRRAEVWCMRFDTRKDEFMALKGLLEGFGREIGELVQLIHDVPILAREIAAPPSAPPAPRDTVRVHATAPAPAPPAPLPPRVNAEPVPPAPLATVSAPGDRLGRRVMHHATREHEWAEETVQRGMQDLRAAYAGRGMHPSEDQLRAEALTTLMEVD